MYICPAGEALLFVSYKREREGLELRRYATPDCSGCKVKRKCTSGSQRVVARREHEHVLEEVPRRLDENPQAMRVRREIKARMGQRTY